MSDIERVAHVLREAEAARTAIGPVSDLVEGGLTLDLAHSVCEANVARREAAGETVVGFKVGFTNIAVRDKMGLPDSTYGYLMGRMVLDTGGAIDTGELIAPKIETEICMRLGRDLVGPGTTSADVLAATDAVRASFEICDARIRDWKCPYPDFFADNGFSARIVLGARGWIPVAEVDLLAETVVLARDGVPFAEGKGEMALGNPANAVAWLANKLAERGRGLKAGMVVMTGTLTAITPIERGSTYSATFSTLGIVDMTFA
ncbi:MAG: fumarylacetoacetate hydrolase family protein [Chloroflexi bacterium]|nr:fumarylacetoacetate hydrolase family protein [Chloroflexota bacterium]